MTENHPPRSEGSLVQSPAAPVSSAFQTFMREATPQSTAWGGMVRALAESSSLGSKTSALAYLGVLAALRMEGGVPFHVQIAKREGASRREVIDALLIGLPAAGHAVTQVLPIALAAYDAE